MRLVKAVTAVTLLFTTSIQAEPEEASIARKTPSFHLGLRTGFSIPLGNTQGASAQSGIVETALSDAVYGTIPLVLDLGYRVTPHLLLGIYGQYGYVFVKENEAGCPSGANCSAADYRFGLEGRYDLSPEEPLRPWFGVGMGYEILTGTGTYSGFEFTRSYWGFEFVNRTYSLPPVVTPIGSRDKGGARDASETASATLRKAESSIRQRRYVS